MRAKTPLVEFEAILITPDDPLYCDFFLSMGETREFRDTADVHVIMRPDVTNADAAQVLRDIHAELRRGKPQSTVGIRWLNEKLDGDPMPF